MAFNHYAAGLGGGRRRAIHLDEANCQQLWRHAQSAGGALAQRDQNQERSPFAMAPCGGCRTDLFWKRRACRSRNQSTAPGKSRCKASAWADLFDDNPSAPDRHLTQYFEIIGNRGIYHDGWLAGTVHKAPWEMQPRATLANDKWELYDTRVAFQSGQ